MSARLYVEGGGDHNKALDSLCRKGFSEFLRKSGLSGRMPRIVACGGRQQAFQDFRIALMQEPNGVVLLVDSEGPVDGLNPWEHVRQRTGDEWERPAGAGDNQLQLMVQTMEAWFYGDRAALGTFYGQGFRASALSARTDIEAIPKSQLFSALRDASRDCQKGEYSKGEHSFHILARIDPAKVRGASPWCERLLSWLDQVCR